MLTKNVHTVIVINIVTDGEVVDTSKVFPTADSLILLQSLNYCLLHSIKISLIQT